MAATRTLLRQALPTGFALGTAIVAATWVVLGSLLSVAVAAVAEEGGRLTLAFAMPAMMVFPVVALLLTLAALLTPRRLARGLLQLGAALSFLLVAVGIGVGMALEPEMELGASVFGGLLCGATPMVVVLVPGVLNVVRGVREAGRVADEEGLERALALLRSRGGLDYDEVATLADVERAAVGELLEARIGAGKLAAELDHELGVVASRTYLDEQGRLLPGLVMTRGRVDLVGLARELRVPSRRVKAWVYEAVQRGELHGHADWSEGVLYAAAQAADQGTCPKCGGVAQPVGLNLARCTYCKAEIFL